MRSTIYGYLLRTLSLNGTKVPSKASFISLSSPSTKAYAKLEQVRITYSHRVIALAQLTSVMSFSRTSGLLQRGLYCSPHTSSSVSCMQWAYAARVLLLKMYSNIRVTLVSRGSSSSTVFEKVCDSFMCSFRSCSLRLKPRHIYVG